MSDLQTLRGQDLIDALSRTAAAPINQLLPPPYVLPPDPWTEHGVAHVCTVQTCTKCGTSHYTQGENLFLIRTKRRGGLREFHGLTEIEAIVREGQPQFVVYRNTEVPRCTGCFTGEVIEL